MDGGTNVQIAESRAASLPFVDEPLPTLKKTVHELSGLTLSTSQDQLPDILKKIGAKADELLQQFPNVASDEAVSQSQSTETQRSQSDQTFTYLLLTHPDQKGELRLQEYRTSQKGKPLAQGTGTPNLAGFLSAWLVFSPINQAESRFRYLGEQQMEGRCMFVVAFAQLSESPASSEKNAYAQHGAHIPLQGIAWVDQSDFRIVRLRTDLLRPQPAIRLQQQTSTITFGPVNVDGVGVQLWLPHSANLDMQTNGQYFHEEHKYSHYRLYQSGSTTLASAQQNPRSPLPTDDIKTQATKLYAGAQPYIDKPPSELKRDVQELSGLKPATSQDSLSSLLASVGTKTDELMHKVPDLISDEAVSETQWTITSGMVPGCVGGWCQNSGERSSKDMEFNYLIVAHPGQASRVQLQEYRTTRKGKAVDQSAGVPSFQGFISTWIVFSSANQVESHFRYLGKQQKDGHKTFVIGFAQIPDRVESPGVIVLNHGSIPMLLQGIAWVDQTDFRIVRLRTDLLAPQPEIQVQRQTADILFGPIKIADFSLWLPQAVNLEMESRGQILREEHRYSKYRLYGVKSKIISRLQGWTFLDSPLAKLSS